MTPDQIRSHPAFASLNARHQSFMNALLDGQDKVAAAHKVWECKNDASARTLANRALQNETFAHLYTLYFGQDVTRVQFTRESALEFLASKARNTKDERLALDYLKLVVAMSGWLVKAAEKPDAPSADDSNEEFTL